MSAPAGWRTWRAAMTEALYGDDGFYRRAGAPGNNFRTAAHASAHWARAIGALAERVDAALGTPEHFTVVDMGAGGGELLIALAASAPPRWRLCGVDVCPRPAAVPPRVEWVDAAPAGYDGLLLAVEWLDVVPVDVVELTTTGVRYVEVSSDGEERLGGSVSTADEEWLGRWWPPAEVGDRAEVGSPRDTAWSTAVAGLRRGLAVAVDYAVDPARDVAGTLTGYYEGRQVVPVPDGSCDITAHVRMEACAAAAAAAADATRLLSQRDALHALGVDGRRPAYAGDPRDYLRRLSAAGEAAELLDPGGLGAFQWLVQARGVPLPF